MLTPQKIQDLADPIESVYINMVNALMVNIGKHLTSPTWTHTAAWEIQKLSELGQLTQENAAIINAWIAQIPQEIRRTMEATRQAALADIERQMQQAARDGYVTPPIADSTIQILEDMAAQAADALNLVNTNMLQSSVAQFQRAVQLTAEEVQRLEAQAAATQTILNEAAGNVASGVETRTMALRRAIQRISDEGLTGFVDRAGRSWTPEAYVNMNIRTTVHNTAIQSVKGRMADFGTSVFQVSSHAGARPGCYPYQGKFYSWDNSSGSVELGIGSFVDYEPLNVTTYGQPAGLFGINCGHFPIPIVPGVTIPHGADNIQPPEENAMAYAESQEQRRLEREIREQKRLLEMAGESATSQDKARLRELQSQMRDFINRTGRTRRYDREQVNLTPPTREGENTGGTAATAQNTPSRDIFRNVQGVDEDFKNGMADTLNNSSNADARALYTQYADDLVCVNPTLSRGAHFSSRDRGVSMNTANVAAGSGYETPYEVAFHEFGHMIDWIGGGKNAWTYLSNTPIDGTRLLEVLKSDFQTFKKSLGVSKAASVIPILREEMRNTENGYLVYGNVSDILEKFTNTSYPLGIGHGVKYHKRDGATEREFFAEVLDSAVANPASYNQMQRLFPNGVEMVWDMVRSITNNMEGST